METHNIKFHFDLFPFKKILARVVLIFISSLLVASCDEIPSGVVDVKNVDYKIISVNAPVVVNYLPADSTVYVSLKIEKVETVQKVWAVVASEDGKTSIKSYLEMFDDGILQITGDAVKGDGIYSAKFSMSKVYSSGIYFVNFFVEDNVKLSPENQVKVGSHKFLFNSSTQNFIPVISNLFLQEMVKREEKFIFTIKVEDQNGLNDVSQVYFKLFRPDGSQTQPSPSQDFFLMVDNGDLENFGDQTANDGVYSYKNSFGTTSQTGMWRFEFQAKDKSGTLSNKIVQSIQVIL